jgi:hypothetical protein
LSISFLLVRLDRLTLWPLAEFVFHDNHPERNEVDKKEITICGLMTSPRYVNNFCRDHIDAAFVGCKIPLQNAGGVFYGQCMQRMLEQVTEDGCDVAVVCDGDSLFTSTDIMRLVQTLVSRDDIDALASMQIRRGGQSMLASIRGGNTVEIDGTPFKVATAHFGLTAIKLKKLGEVQKPWFWSQPDANGRWGDGRTDDDIWFWRQWERAGNSLYMDPQTRIGHMEEMVVMVHPETYEAIHAYPVEWQEACKSN